MAAAGAQRALRTTHCNARKRILHIMPLDTPYFYDSEKLNFVFNKTTLQSKMYPVLLFTSNLHISVLYDQSLYYQTALLFPAKGMKWHTTNKLMPLYIEKLFSHSG